MPVIHVKIRAPELHQERGESKMESWVWNWFPGVWRFFFCRVWKAAPVLQRHLHGHTRTIAPGLFVDLGISPCSNFATLTKKCALCFSTHMFVLHWYLQVCFFLALPASISFKSSFSFARPVRSKPHDLSQLFGQVGMVAHIVSPHETPNIRH